MKGKVEVIETDSISLILFFRVSMIAAFSEQVEVEGCCNKESQPSVILIGHSIL